MHEPLIISSKGCADTLDSMVIDFDQLWKPRPWFLSSLVAIRVWVFILSWYRLLLSAVSALFFRACLASLCLCSLSLLHPSLVLPLKGKKTWKAQKVRRVKVT